MSKIITNVIYEEILIIDGDQKRDYPLWVLHIKKIKKITKQGWFNW